MKNNECKRGSKRKRKYPKYLNKPAKSPYFHYCFVVEPNGRPERGSTGLTDEKEAKAYVDDLRELKLAQRKLRMVAKNEQGKTIDMPLLAAIDRYNAEKNGVIKRSDNLRRYCDVILEIIDPGTMLTKIDSGLASSFVATLRNRLVKGKDGFRKIAPSHAKAIVSTLSSILDEANDGWAVPLPNSPNFARYKFARASRKRYFSADEMVRTETNMTTDIALVYYFLLLTGLRLRNGVEITWGQIDWDNLKIKVLAKGDVEQEVDITPLVAAILRTQERLYPWAKPSDSVFKTIARAVIKDPDGNCLIERGEAYPMKGHTFYRALKAACRKAEVDDARPHDLRRTCGTMTLRTTSDITIVQDRLGHRDVRVTKQNYAFVLRDAVTEGARLTEKETARQLEQARERRAAAGRVDVRRVNFEPASNRPSEKGVSHCRASTFPALPIPARGVCTAAGYDSWATTTSLLSRSKITIKTIFHQAILSRASAQNSNGTEACSPLSNGKLRTFYEPASDFTPQTCSPQIREKKEHVVNSSIENRSGSMQSIEYAREIVARLELNEQYQDLVKLERDIKANIGTILDEKISSDNLVGPKLGPNKHNKVRSKQINQPIDLLPNLINRNISRRWEPYENDIGFIISFFEALERCFSEGTPSTLL